MEEINIRTPRWADSSSRKTKIRLKESEEIEELKEELYSIIYHLEEDENIKSQLRTDIEIKKGKIPFKTTEKVELYPKDLKYSSQSTGKVKLQIGAAFNKVKDYRHIVVVDPILTEDKPALIATLIHEHAHIHLDNIKDVDHKIVHEESLKLIEKIAKAVKKSDSEPKNFCHQDLIESHRYSKAFNKLSEK